jgi:hypothetical protein
MGLQLTDRQKKIYNEFIKNSLVKEVSRPLEINCDEMTNKLIQLTKVNDTDITEKEYLENEYCEIMKLYASNDFGNNLYDIINKFTKLGLHEHILSPNEFEYILNELENILNKEKEKNDELCRRKNEWNVRADNFLNLCKV